MAHQTDTDGQSFDNSRPAKRANPSEEQGPRALLSRVVRYVSITQWLPTYSRAWLRGDLIAGVTLVALAVPESLGYAQIAGLPVQLGLYAALGGLIGYALFGSSRQLVVGPSSALAAVSAATVAAVSPAGSDRYLALSAGLAIAVALIALIAGLAHLGFIAQFLAEPVLTGFIFGLSMTIIIRQAPKLFGVKGGDGGFFQRLWDLVIQLGDTNGWTLLIGVASLAILFGLKRFARRIPASLVAVIFGVLVISIFNLDHYGVAIVGAIPQGLPHFGLPAVSLSDFGVLISGAMGLALVAYAEHIGAASEFASKHHQDIDANQELIGLGVANLGAGVCQGFAVGGSLSKTAANDTAGARSQVSSLAAAAFVLLTLLLLTPLFHNLPDATLGAVVIFAVWGLLDVAALQRYWRLRRTDCVLALVALGGELVFDVLPGLLIAVALSLLILIYRASRPHLAVLGRAPDRTPTSGAANPTLTDGMYAEIVLHPEYTRIPGLLIVRVDAPLFFANATSVRDGVRALVHAAQPTPRLVLLDLEATDSLDVSSADMLVELTADLSAQRVSLALVRVHTHVREMLMRSDERKALGAQNFYASVGAGVAAYLEQPQVIPSTPQNAGNGAVERGHS